MFAVGGSHGREKEAAREKKEYRQLPGSRRADSEPVLGWSHPTYRQSPFDLVSLNLPLGSEISDQSSLA